MRRDLATSPFFDEVSPDVGELDEAAVDEAMDVDADEMMSLLASMAGATDARLRERARQLAARLFLDITRDRRPDRRGVGRITTQRFRPDGGDLDIDASMAELIEARAVGRAIDPEGLAIRAWSNPSTAWCLCVDRSGSMFGRPLATAALAAAAVAVRAEGDYAVLSFARDVVAPKAIWERRSTEDVIDRVLALRGHGTTDVAAALLAAGAQLRAASAQRRIVVLLSDCRSTEPGDVYGAARSLDELVILAPEGDDEDAAALAGAVGARFATVAGPTSVPAALAAVLAR